MANKCQQVGYGAPVVVQWLHGHQVQPAHWLNYHFMTLSDQTMRFVGTAQVYSPSPGERVHVALLRQGALPFIGRIQGMPLARHLQELERSQWWSAEQLRALQEHKLRRLLAHAYAQVPLYRRLWDRAGVHPQDIQGLADLPRLPLVSKATLRQAYPLQAVARNADSRQLVPYASSGSTGEPLQFVMSRSEKGLRWANMFRCWGWAGLRQGLRCANVKDGHALGTFQNGPLRSAEQRLTNMLNLSAYAVHDERLEQALAALLRFRPKFMLGYPATVFRLAQALAERGQQLPLQGVITSGEVLFPFQRAAIERQFGCPLFDFYGGEGMDVAMQCGHGPWYHINAESVIAEVLDEAGQPAPAGQEGQIVLTNLNNLAMPFIRYAIADQGALLPPEQRCPCGRGLPLMAHVTGRSSDQLVLPSGRQLIMWYFTDVFRQMPGVASFQMRQTAADCIAVSIAPGPDFGHLPAGPAHRSGQGVHSLGQYVGRDEAIAYLRQRLEEQVRGEAALDMRLVSDIPLGPGGKHRFFLADRLQSPAEP